MKKLFLMLILLATVTWSYSQISPLDKTEHKDLKVLQVTTSNSYVTICLATDNSYNISHIVFIDTTQILYDNKDISGDYIMIGAYTYQSRGFGEQTVPSYMPKKDFFYLASLIGISGINNYLQDLKKAKIFSQVITF